MELTRRNFLKGVLALGVVSAVPLVDRESLPVIWGDGVHDDAPGLNALFAGKPFHVEAKDLIAYEGKVIGGHFRLGSPLYLSRPGKVTIRDSYLEALPHFKGEAMIVVDDALTLADIQEAYLYP